MGFLLGGDGCRRSDSPSHSSPLGDEGPQSDRVTDRVRCRQHFFRRSIARRLPCDARECNRHGERRCSCSHRSPSRASHLRSSRPRHVERMSPFCFRPLRKPVAQQVILSFLDNMPDRSHPNVYSPWGRGSGIIRRAICLEADSNVKHEKRIRRRKVESHSKRVAEPTGLESVQTLERSSQRQGGAGPTGSGSGRSVVRCCCEC